MEPRNRLPVGLVSLLGATIVGTVLYRTIWPGLFELVRRDPDALSHGQVWRVITPILVQPDPVGTAVTVFVLVAIAGIAAERAFGTRIFLLLYLGGALAAHVVGEWWQPYDSGTSVAGCGALGGLALAWIWSHRPLPALRGVALLGGGVWLLTRHDIHGVGLVAGAVIGSAVLGRRSTA